MISEAYFFEVGILLDHNDKEFDSYNMVYDHKWGYFNENWGLIKKNPKEFEELKDYIRSYVADGNNHTYGIIEYYGEVEYEEDEEYAWDSGGGEICSIYDIKGSFKVQDVVWSIAKIDGKTVENFLKN